jgi:hypothetical protein
MKRIGLLAVIALPLCAVPARAQSTYLHPTELPPHLRTNSSIERGWRLLNERRCTVVTDGCNRATRTWTYGPGRYIERGFLVTSRLQVRQTWLVVSRDAPVKGDDIAGAATAMDCPGRHEYVCVEGSPPPPPPLPPRAGPPIGQGWLEQTELHASWIDLSYGRTSIGCRPIDYRLSTTLGGLLPRKIRLSTSLCSFLAEVR